MTSTASIPWLSCAVTERAGGVSDAPFATLNLGLHVGDAADNVLANRRLAAQSLGFSLEQMVCAEQVHGSAVAVVGAEMAGRGAIHLTDALPGVDALITDTPGLLLTLFYADCFPILLADPTHQAVAVAHAGWKGIVANVVENTVAAMQANFGTMPGDIVAEVGPGIGACCFEVGTDVAARFPAAFVRADLSPDKARVDLAGAVASRLATMGVPAANIAVSGSCTACLPGRYFSYRRDNGVTGRMAAMIGIRYPT